MIVHRATLDVPRELVQFVARLLAAERRRRGTPRGSRALTCFWQAVLGLRWFRDRTAPEALARDHGISRATAYRYLDEVIAVLAEQAPELREALERARDEGFSDVILDGKVIACDRCKEPAVSIKGEVTDLWYSGKARRHGGNVQAVLARTGSRYGSRRRSPARCTTSPRPAPTPCPRFTRPPPPACPPSPTPAMRARAWASSFPSGNRPAAGTLTSIPVPATPSSAHNPRRTSSHVRKAPGSALNPAAIMTCPAGCGRSSRRPAGPVALPRRDAHRGQRAAGYAAHRQAPGYHRGYDEILARRRLPPLTAAGLSLCDESFACYLLREAAW